MSKDIKKHWVSSGIQYNGSTYLSVKDVSEKTSLNPNTIRAYCNRGMNNHGFNSIGFYWRYAKDMN